MAEAGSGRNPHTSAIAEFVAGLRYEAIPAEVIARLKLLVLDALGCAIYAAELPWSRLLLQTLETVDTSRGATVWGTARRLSAPHAALVNGTLVQGFELDDVHRVGMLHVGAVTLPPLVAIAELRPGMSGRDFLRAAVAGYEIGPRVGLCMGPQHLAQGWHTGATFGVFAAAAGAAAALRLPPEGVVHALGIAGTQAAGLMAAQYGAMVKRMHAGRSAQSGLYGALLAERGFTGIVDVFESAYGGFCTTFSRSADGFDLAALSAGLGERFETMRVFLKFYACNASIHSTLDVLKEMRARRPFAADEVERIHVRASRATAEHVGWRYRAEGLTAAQLNLPYCVATLLLEADVFVAQFDEAAVHDAARIALAGRIEVAEDPAITARGAAFRHMVHVEVRLRDGTVLAETIDAPRRNEHRFAGEADIVEKFRKLADGRLPPGQADRLAELTLGLDKATTVDPLIAALALPG
jgi:2-methylcitrate dehydratase PrpD